MLSRRLVALFAVLVIAIAACSSGGTSPAPAASEPAASEPAASEPAAASGSPAASAAAGDITVGVSWNNYNEERWAKADEPAIKAALAAAGAEYISSDAGSSADQQLADVENLIAQGADALIILAQDGTAIKPAVTAALDAGIPVIAYDRLIEDPGAFYITFDNVAVGRMEAEEVLKVVPEGNFVIIKGNSADANADFLRAGMVEAGIPEVDGTDPAGKINIVGETYTDNWDPGLAQTEMEQFLTQNNNDIQAALVENDGMAGGAIAALEAAGLAGEIPVSGQDGDKAALNRVALGTQTVSVWKDATALGTTAGAIAAQLAQGAALETVAAPDGLPEHAVPTTGTAATKFTTPGGVEVNSIILNPVPILKDNLNLVIDSGWVTQDEVCQNVTAGSVAACP